jgi:Family of unknown function (DUF6328)
MASRYDDADDESAESGEGSNDTEQNERDETEAERLDRNYNELLQEMRVLQAGIQILFAFLLSLAFQQRFTEVTDLERDIYVVTLIFACLSTACILAPVSFHRLVFRRGMKDELMRAANKEVAAGLVLLFIAMHGAVLLVLAFLLGLSFAIIAVAAIAVIYLLLWLVVPLVARAREANDEQDKP